MDAYLQNFSKRKLEVSLFSEPNFLALNILENLLSRNCVVNIFSRDAQAWRTRTKHLDKSFFSILGLKDYLKADAEYVVFCSGFLRLAEIPKDWGVYLKNIVLRSRKTLLVLPLESFSTDLSEKFSSADNLGLIYVSDILGPRIDLDSDLTLPKSLVEMYYKKTLSVPTGEVYYPMFVADAAKVIARWLFSFGPFGKEIVLSGEKVSSSDFWKYNMVFLPELKIKYLSGLSARSVPKGLEIKFLGADLNFMLGETYKWLSVNPPQKIYSAPPRTRLAGFGKFRLNLREIGNVKLSERSAGLSKKIIRAVFLSVLILILPFLLTLSSWGTLYYGYRQFLSGHDEAAVNFVLFSRTLFTASQITSLVFEKIPGLDKVYLENSFLSRSGRSFSEMALVLIPSAKKAQQLFTGILGSDAYDPKVFTDYLKTSSDYLYRQISLLEADLQEARRVGLVTPSIISSRINFEKNKDVLSQVGIILGNSDEILGINKKESYLLLFQNNMELRPTGGFIGSYAVLNLDAGRISDFNINDVYSADGQLKGHIEPPAPIKKYLGEANWWLRDSNWDPDFPISAQRAEWFLDKETDQQVDGVIGIDLEPIKEILKYTGPIFLPDFNLTISQDNIYEKTQEEVQDHFFPGTHKKASFLTALSRQLLVEIDRLDDRKKMQVIKILFHSLESRHTQIYLNNRTPQRALLDLNWGGELFVPTCGDICYPDLVALVEANVGVNKANYFVKRNVDLSVAIGREKISRRLDLQLQNNANLALGDAGRYKAYIRLIVPQDVSVSYISEIVGGNETVLTPEVTQGRATTEVGVPLEVLPGQTIRLVFSWQTSLPKDSIFTSYALYIRKQAGVTDDPWSIILKAPDALKPSSGFALTREGAYTYNTILSEDLFSKFSW